MAKRYIISLDQGTTSSRAIVFDREKKEIISMKSKPLQQIYPNPGWVEHDPEEIWTGQLEVMRDAVRDSLIKLEDIACVGITNQRETVVVWDKSTGKPIHNAIVWQCRRTAAICSELKDKGLKKIIQEKNAI